MFQLLMYSELIILRNNSKIHVIVNHKWMIIIFRTDGSEELFMPRIDLELITLRDN